MSKQIEKMCLRATMLGASNVIAHNPSTIELIDGYHPRFMQNFLHLCEGEHRRGCKHGFWAWKSLVVLDALSKANTEYVIYTDCNCEKYEYLLKNMDNIFKMATSWNEKVCMSTEKYKIYEVVKKSVRDTRGYTWRPEHRSLHANVIILRNVPAVLDMVREWAYLCTTDAILPERDEKLKVWHTHDQAILSVLVYKHKLCRKFFYTSEWDKFYLGNHP